MTIGRVEKITGYQVRQEVWTDPSGRVHVRLSALDDGLVVAAVSVSIAKLKHGLSQLSDEVLKAHRAIVLKRQGYKCGECGGLKALTVHHKVHRSKSRDDRLSNLIGLCHDCHDREHDIKVK